jgi:bisanhydrobacterioruberin hydratase
VNRQPKRHRYSKTVTATGIAVLLHIVGLVGILGYNSDIIIMCTPINLLICFMLLVWTQREKNRDFWVFTIVVCLFGFFIEVIGVNTGKVFGNYTYGKVLGPKLFGTPFIIAVNWFIIIYCCGITTYTLLMKIIGRLAPAASGPPKIIKSLTLLTDGATLATLLDWLMEPPAIRLELWTWTNETVTPWYNYFCWFIVSMLMLGIFNSCRFRRKNKFAINLLLIQLAFFLILRTYLHN